MRSLAHLLLVLLAAALVLALPMSAGAAPAVTAVTGGGNHSCAIKSGGTVVCWGEVVSGQSSPPGDTFSAIGAGLAHTCGLKSDGTLACWGWDGYNQVSGMPSGTFVALSAGSRHSCGIRTGGTLACWGDGNSTHGTPAAETFAAVDSGANGSCGIRTDGTLVCWGLFYRGGAPPGGTFLAVASGGAYYDHGCAIETGGSLACWGDSTYGQASPPSGAFNAVTAGQYHSCGLKADGTIQCWGGNDYNQVTNTPSSGTFTAVAAGDYHTCAIKTSGSVTCWGSPGNTFGNPLGSAPQTPSPAPPHAQVGAAYSHYFTPSGSPRGTFAHTGGTLPPGLSLTDEGLSGGHLSGTPTTAGTYTFTLTVSNGVFDDASAQFTIEVATANPTAVRLIALAATRSASGIVLRWRTASEFATLGFNVYRGGVQINRTLIPTRGRTAGGSYRFLDRAAQPGRRYAYRLEAVGPDARRHLVGRVMAYARR